MIHNILIPNPVHRLHVFLQKLPNGKKKKNYQMELKKWKACFVLKNIKIHLCIYFIIL